MVAVHSVLVGSSFDILYSAGTPSVFGYGYQSCVQKTKAKSLAEVRTAGKLLWLGFDRIQPNRRGPEGKHRRIIT